MSDQLQNNGASLDLSSVEAIIVESNVKGGRRANKSDSPAQGVGRVGVAKRARAGKRAPAGLALSQRVASPAPAAVHSTVSMFSHDDLVRSKLNVRRRETDVGELVALIRAYGLLQNLIGYRQMVNGAATGKAEIVAGGRRLEALSILLDDGTLPRDYGIPVLIVTEAEAIEISMAENRGRTDMHPADVYTAMLALTARGRSIEDIAIGFNLDVLTVKRCLKLAKLSPRLLELYRQDEANFEQMMALALSDDHAAQEQAWDALPPHRRSAHDLRRLLTDQQINVRQDRLARFVGIEAFEQAGGVVTRDLFSDSGAGYIADGALLERLAMAKLELHRESLSKESGVYWVEILPRADYAQLAEYGRVRTALSELCEQGQCRLAALESEISELEEQMEALGDDDPAAADSLSAQLAQLEGEHCTLLQSREQKPMSDDAALAGAVITLDEAGEVIVKHNLIRPVDKVRMVKLAAEDGKAPTRSKTAHSDRLTHVLTSHRTAALQAELLERPDVSLVVLTHTLLTKLLLPQRGASLMAKLALTTPILADEVKSSPAAVQFSARSQALVAMLPESSTGVEWLDWLSGQPQATLLALLALCVAASLDATQTREGPCPAFLRMAQAVDLDMRKWWTPTATNYFLHLPKERIVSVVKDAISREAAAPLDKLTKAAVADKAERALVGSRWLPAPLRN